MYDYEYLYDVLDFSLMVVTIVNIFDLKRWLKIALQLIHVIVLRK